tara:strand:+ start:414 stop:596 length:183 start_codon:yes stop_codon:yes gene_type:complete
MKTNKIDHRLLTRKHRQQLNEQHAKKMWYCELLIAACLGASIALAFVIVHMMLFGSAWTW